MVNTPLAKPARTRRVGDGRGLRTIARSSRGEIRHPRLSISATSRDTQAVWNSVSNSRPHSHRAAAARPGLAWLGERVGHTQRSRLRVSSPAGHRNFCRHDRGSQGKRTGKTEGPQARAGNAPIIIRTNTSSLHRGGGHQCYHSTEGRRIGGVTRSLSPTLEPRDRLICAIGRTAR